MAYFESSEKLQEVLGGFFRRLVDDPEIGKKLKDSKLVIKFNYSDPNLSITIDCSKDPVPLSFNDAATKAEVEMNMKADVAHRFWFGKVNLLAALTRREMVAKGPIPKVLKLLPVIKPAYDLYPKYLEEKGYGNLLIP
ncbi:MAG: SCP2 sterol-binding domain-containing protein [bacterium]